MTNMGRRAAITVALLLGALGCPDETPPPVPADVDDGTDVETPADADPIDDTSDPADADPIDDAGADATDDPDASVDPVLGFQTVSDEAWDQTAVRKVLQIFAFGSFATDAQIQAWADMAAQAAIAEIITFDEVNPLLNPLQALGEGGTLAQLAAFLASNDTKNPVPQGAREGYRVESWSSPMRTWLTATGRTGLNPVRQRIGLLETGYHLAVNQNAGVNNWQIFRYYDDILNALAQELPYEEVLGIAAGSAAVATQYNHRKNLFIDAKFEGNEDFGREIHQLFFGILGIDDPDYHELVNIRNTSKALTDMQVEWLVDGENDHLADVVTFGSEYHYPGPLEIYGVDVAGTTAMDRIQAIIEMTIAHPESLANLPVLLVRFLADDVIDATEEAAIQQAWAAAEPKELLSFLRAYAISTTFHSPTRVKSWTSVERNLIQTNLLTLAPEEAWTDSYNPWGQLNREGVALFRPIRNVFGGQTGLDAAASGAVFREAYNNSIDRYWFYARTDEEDAQGNTAWTKDWAALIPPAADGTWRVLAVSEWLWQRFVGDGLKNFGTLERAHVYALVGGGKDLALLVDKNNPGAVYSTEELETRADLVELIGDMEIAPVALDSDDSDKRHQANGRVGYAIAFIVTTPYAFAQEGN